MRFSTALFALVSAGLAFAQSPNPFNIPPGGYQTSAGSAVNISWTPTTQGTVSLYLRSGDSAYLNNGTAIACKKEYTLDPAVKLTMEQHRSRTAVSTHGWSHQTSFVVPATLSRLSATPTPAQSTTLLSSSSTALISTPRLSASPLA